MKYYLLLILLLVGCGGNGGSDSPPPTSDPSINGFWKGSTTINNKKHSLKVYIDNNLVYLIGDIDLGYDYFAIGNNKNLLKASTLYREMPKHIWPSDSIPNSYKTIYSPFLSSDSNSPAVSVNFSINDTGQLIGTYSYNDHIYDATATTLVLDKWEASHPSNIDGSYEISFSYHIRFDKDGYPTDYANYIINMNVSNNIPTIQITTQQDGFYLAPYETIYSYKNTSLNFNNGCQVSFIDTSYNYAGFCLSDINYLYLIVKDQYNRYRFYQFNK